MNCPKCGNELDTGFNCPNCGYKRYEQHSSIQPKLTKADVEIEEMAKVLLPAWGKCPREKCPEVRKDLNSCDYCKCELLYAAGYRKQSETVKEFAEKVRTLVTSNYCSPDENDDAAEEFAIGVLNSILGNIVDEIDQIAEQYKEDL